MFWEKWSRALLAVSISCLSVMMPACDAASESEHVNEQLAAFMLDHIVINFFGGSGSSVAPDEQVAPGSVPVPSIIVWAPPGTNTHSPGEILDRNRPIRVWMYTDHRLSQVSDPTATIEEYLKTYVHYPGIESWGFYDFGLFSVSRDRQSAEVYLGISCGPKCGSGYMVTLQRNPSGVWEIIETELVWIV